VQTEKISGTMNVRFRNVSMKNWEEMRRFILASELNFPKSLRFTEQDYLEIFSRRSPVAVAVFNEDGYVGNVVGYPLSNEEVQRHKLGREDEGEIYMCNIVVDPPQNGNGYGQMLYTEIRKRSKNRGHKKIFFHIDETNSMSMREGRQELSRIENWYGTGRTFVLYESAL